MSKFRGKFHVAFAMLVFLSGVTVLLLFPREPRYQGKTLRYWLGGLPNGVRFISMPPNESELALRQMGSKAMPYLLHMLQSRDPAFVEKIKCELDQLPLLKLPYHHAWRERTDALKAVAVLGPQAKQAIPELRKMLDQDLETDWALAALVRIGPDSVPTLLSSLTLANQDLRRSAVSWLTSFKEQKELIVPALLTGLNDSDPAFRDEVIRALRWFGPAGKEAIPRLFELGKAPNGLSIHPAVVSTLVAIDPDWTRKTFLEQLEAPQASTRLAGAGNLRWLKSPGAPAVPALLRHLNDPDKSVRLAAALALGGIGQSAELVIPALNERLKQPDLSVRLYSALALSEFGSQASNAVPDIQLLLREYQTNDQRVTAAEIKQALRKIDPRAEPSDPGQ